MTQPEFSPPNGSDVCVACGLCCTGLLFDLAPLEEPELALAGKLRLPLVRTPMYDAFRLPCPRQEGAVCGVYATRPKVCGSYECGLLQRYVAGEVPLDEALARVTRIREAAADLRGRVPAGSRPRPLWDDARARLEVLDDPTAPPERRAEREALAEALTELRAAIRRDLDP
ncbi:MAG TPA: YkgJ family cysteine cluster protein [Candidatus Nanopelagicales bacterium]|nr:YkgJ family cysteine cluster protein [Candidatus Nanopelagicales bacterium]